MDLAGPFFAAALLLGVAGAIKALTPDATRVALRSAGLPSRAWLARLLGVVELVIAGTVVAVGGRLPAAFLALAYLGFAGFSIQVKSRSRGRAPCGCFGSSDSPITNLHVVVDLAIAALAGGLAILTDPVEPLGGAASGTPLGGAVYVAFVVVLAWLIQMLLTVLPALDLARTKPARVARAARTSSLTPSGARP